MPDDPIERLSAEIEVYGIPQVPGQPPMTDTYLHIRKRQDGAVERATMGLPAYQGEQGERGAPGAIHQGERTTAQLEALRAVLGKAETNWAYRNTDTNDQYVWTGSTFVIYHQVFATPGPVGPAPVLQPGELTVDGEPQTGDYGVRVTGASGSYSIGIDLPKSPRGEQGLTGPSGSVIVSQDVKPGQTPNRGDALIYIPDATYPQGGRLEWQPVHIPEWVVPPSGFPNVSKASTDTTQLLCTVNIPAQTFPYRFDFAGGVDVNAKVGHLINTEIRLNDATNGAIVGIGKGQEGEGWREVPFRAHSSVAIDPTSNLGVIAPGTPATLFVRAVKVSGILFGWDVRNANAQLRIRLMRTAVY